MADDLQFGKLRLYQLSYSRKDRGVGQPTTDAVHSSRERCVNDAFWGWGPKGRSRWRGAPSFSSGGAEPRRKRPASGAGTVEYSGRCWIRTNVGVSRQVYSLLPLAARATFRGFAVQCLRRDRRRTSRESFARRRKHDRASERNRTANHLFTKQVLYQLSYASGCTPLSRHARDRASGGARGE